MARGKKDKKGKNIEEKSSSISVSDVQETPQTEDSIVSSTNISPESVKTAIEDEPAHEEESEGLGLGGGKKKKRPKKVTKIQPASDTSKPGPSTSTSVDIVPPSSDSATHGQVKDLKIPEPAKPAEEVEGGLGLGGEKKDKKVKTIEEKLSSISISDVQETSQTQDVSMPSGSVSATQGQVKDPRVPEPAKPADDDDGEGGLGLGGGRSKKRPKKKKIPTTVSTGDTPVTVQSTAQDSTKPEIKSLPTTSSSWSSKPTQFQTHSSAQSQGSLPAIQHSDSHVQQQRELSRVRPEDKLPTQRTIDRQTTQRKFVIPEKMASPSSKNIVARTQKVITNYLPMSIKPMKLFRYDVLFKPDKPKKFIPLAYFKAKQILFPKILIAFDQVKNCYTIQRLPGVTEERRLVNVEVEDNNGRKVPFEVSFKMTGQVDFNTILQYMKSGTSLSPPTEAIQAVDVILRQGTLESYVKAGKQFFKRPAKPFDLGDGLEMWTGLFQSAIFTSKAYINVDVAHKGFPRSQPLIAAMKNDFRLNLDRPIMGQRGADSFLQFIKGLKVMAVIGGDRAAGVKREFICNGLLKPPNQIMFEMTTEKGTKKISVKDYFEKEKKYRIEYPNIECMSVGPKKVSYPVELLEIVYGQARNKQLNERQLATMVREAATPPNVRLAKIEEVLGDMKYSKSSSFKEFGLQIEEKFLEVDSKVLNPPRLLTGQKMSTDVRNGVWRTTNLYKPGALESWGLFAVEVDSRTRIDYESIIKMTMRVGIQMGMRVAEPAVTNFNVRMTDLRNYLYRASEMKINFVFIIVGNRDRDCYHKVKQYAELDIGILTQCIKEQTAEKRMNEQTIRNILLKVNSKLMGINQVLDGSSIPNCLKGGNVMVIGADVTHPSPDQISVPSIAAVTASLDPNCYQYNITLSVQSPKEEIILEFRDMMIEHLQVYKKCRGKFPTKFYVFRDGVSEGQFAKVMASELTAIHDAYQRMTGSPTKPEVLFLLVQKRHHTRLFGGPRNQIRNVDPGTVVDTEIVHARELDFYLVSHQAIKGTARPTRYHAVCNDDRLPDDQVEQLTYYLCHLYSRCMRSVSYPTPTYYAHLACTRAKSLNFGDRKLQDTDKTPKRLVINKINQLSPMFFV